MDNTSCIQRVVNAHPAPWAQRATTCPQNPSIVHPSPTVAVAVEREMINESFRIQTQESGERKRVKDFKVGGTKKKVCGWENFFCAGGL